MSLGGRVETEASDVLRVCCVLTLLLIRLGLASEVAAQAVSVGARGGVAVSHIGPGWKNGSRAGLTGGVAGRLLLSRALGIEVGASWTQKGIRAGQYHLLLDYIEVPVVVRFSLLPPALAGARLSALVGASVSSEVRCRWRTDMGVDYFGVPDPPFDANCLGIRSRRTDIGVVVGAQLERPFSGRYVLLDGRFVQGTTNISPGGWTLRNRSVQIQVGVGWNVSRHRRAAT